MCRTYGTQNTFSLFPQLKSGAMSAKRHQAESMTISVKPTAFSEQINPARRRNTRRFYLLL